MATYPEQDVNKTQPRLKSDDRNPLHDFSTYNCLFTLSGLRESELQNQQGLFTSEPLHDVIARSAGIGENFVATVGGLKENPPSGIIGQEDIPVIGINPVIPANYKDSFGILTRNHDIFFENVNITSTVGPNTERNLANFTKMEFELHEPYGVTFIEKIRGAAFNNGYEDYQAAPFLLTIEWKGFDDNGKPLADKSKGLVRKVPIFITRVDFDVDQGGARYSIVAVPYAEMAFDDSYKYPRTVIPVAVDNIFSWIRAVKKGLAGQMQDEIDEGVRLYPDLYEFDVSRIGEFIRDGRVITKQTSSIFNTATVDELTDKEPLLNDVGTALTDLNPSAKKQSMNIDANTNVVKAFEDMIRSSGYYQRLLTNFWETFTEGETEEGLAKKMSEGEGLKGKSPYVNWFFIKPKLENLLERGLDPITKMYPKKITYQAVPYKVHVLKLITAGMSFGEVDWEKYARRKYNYIYTGDNVDIQNLRINYKTAYYYRNVRRDAKAVAGEEGKLEAFAEKLKKLFGVEKTPPEPSLPLRQYPSVLKQRNLVQEINPASNKAQEFFDYLTNPEADMVSLEMEILGDPAYVAQDIFAPLEGASLSEGEYDAPNSSFNMQSYMPVVHLKYRIPADIDVKRGTMFSDRYLDENLFFSGAYQVTKVESSMNQGQFTQTLTMVRLNNQSGMGTDPILRKAAVDDAIKQDNISSVVRKGQKAGKGYEGGYGF